MNNQLFRGRKKGTLRIWPNPIACKSQRGLRCFGGHPDLAHVVCWRAHFGLTPANNPSAIAGTNTHVTVISQCVYCGCDLTELNITSDHVIPISRGGKKRSPVNRAPSCSQCNNDKGPLTVAEYLRVKDDPEARVQLISYVAAKIEGRL